MNSSDKERIIDRYRRRLEEHDSSVQAMASGTRERQRIRFGVLAAVGDLNGTSLLDLGCGLGDFYAYLQERGVDVDYVGYDISPDLVEEARGRFAGANFEVRDIQEDGIPRTFDYAVCSQTFNNELRHEDNRNVVREVLSLLHDHTERGVAIDFLTNYVDFEEEHLHYYSPAELFDYCKGLTKRVTLRHDYPLFEFTLYLYPDFTGWNSE